MAMLSVFTEGQLERLAVKLFRSPVLLTSNRLSSEGRRQKSMAHPNPKFLKRVSERCQLVVAPQRDSWQWSVDPSKVLIVLMTWLGAKDKHILRYSDLYTKQGLDVLIVKSKAKDFIWPRNSMALAEHVCTVLGNQMQAYDHIVSHTMSVGAFNWTVLRLYLKEKGNPEHICCKLRGQVMDSVVAGAGKGGILDESPAEGQPDVHALDRMVHGIVLAKKRNPVMQWTIESLSKGYFALTKGTVVKFFEKSLNFFREEPLQAPTLFLASRDDPMCDASVLEKLVNIWKAEHTFYVSIKVWDSSPHTQHYIYHKEEYEKLHEELFKEIFLPLQSTKDKSRNMKSNL